MSGFPWVLSFFSFPWDIDGQQPRRPSEAGRHSGCGWLGCCTCSASVIMEPKTIFCVWGFGYLTFSFVPVISCIISVSFFATGLPVTFLLSPPFLLYCLFVLYFYGILQGCHKKVPQRHWLKQQVSNPGVMTPLGGHISDILHIKYLHYNL